MMSWREKLEVTTNCVSVNPRLAIVFTRASAAPVKFIEAIKREFPFVDEGYLDFLRTTDGAQIDMFVFCGSGESPFQSLWSLLARWNDTLRDGELLPIGTDAAGSCIAIDQAGQVFLLGNDPPDPKNVRVLASSFDEFLEQILIGPRFAELFGEEWSDEQENEWTAHLRERGWM